MFSFFSKDQSFLEERISEANAEMSLRNMCQTIIWGKSPTNPYLFEQSKGQVKYRAEERGYELIIKPQILGTFNLDDKTFLWSDKNPSVQEALSDKVETFRAGLPKKYRKDKFKSTPAFCIDLLSLFSFDLNANGFDNQRQDDTLIFYALLEVRISEAEKEIAVLEPGRHFHLLEEQAIVPTIQEFHKEQVDINRRHNEGKLELEEAFREIRKVHLKYWLNEDPYFFPSLSWPCGFDEESVFDWKEFKLDDNRHFVIYRTDLGWTKASYAYEIDTKAEGVKLIVNEYD